MSESTSEKVAMSLLEEVEKRIEGTLGNQIALPYGPEAAEYSPSAFCEEMVKQCNIAEKKAPDSKEVLIKSNILKAQLYGNWYDPLSLGQRRTHNKAVECYEKALALGGDEALIRYRMALLYRVHAGKQKAIENFERVIQLVGADSELGIECAKELEKEKASKGGCFIATAVYDLPTASEVELLRQFRDKVLLQSITGKVFVAIYYRISPPIARIISRSEMMKKLLRSCILEPIIKFITKWQVKP
jgi:tetratricopeptide (TPR) repeat protein